MAKLTRYQAIQHLDPVTDHIEICRQLAGYEFPWDVTRSLELALFRTFCIPKIAALLDQTGEFHQRGQKRYDDTGLMVSLILKWGYDTPSGQAVIQRMNHIHRHFAIANDDFLYVLSTFIYEPIRWIDRFGWRSLTDLEKQALFYFWVAVGAQMDIHSIPPTYADFEQYNREYERQHMQFANANQRVGSSTVNLFLSWFPGVSRPFIRPLVYAMMDEAMVSAFGFPAAALWQRQTVERLLRSRSWVVRHLPPRQTPHFFSDTSPRSYPHGYELADLGPPPLLSRLNRRSPPSE